MLFVEVNPSNGAKSAATEDAVRTFNRGIQRANMLHNGAIRKDAMDRILADLGANLDSHAKRQIRSDAASPGLGYWQPNDLTVRAREVFAEPEPDMVMSYVPIQREGQVGMNDVELLREFYGGRAHVYQGGNGATIPTASVARSPLRVPLICFMVKVQMDFLDRERERATGRDIFGAKLTAAKRALSQALNEAFLTGDAASGLPGMLANNPYIPQLKSSVGISSASTAAQIIAAVGSLIDNVRTDSRGAYRPDTCLMAGSIMDYMSRTLVDTGSGMSIMDFLEKSYSREGRRVTFRAVDALNGRGVSGATEPIFVGRLADSAGASVKLELTMEPTPIASVSDGLVNEVYVAAVCGGAHPRYPTANAVGNYDT